MKVSGRWYNPDVSRMALNEPARAGERAPKMLSCCKCEPAREGVVAVIRTRDRRGQEIVGQGVQRRRGIGQMGGDHMDHLVIVLDPSAHLHQPRAHYDLALLLLEIGPDDEIDHPGLVLEGDETHPLG